MDGALHVPELNFADPDPIQIDEKDVFDSGSGGGFSGRSDDAIIDAEAARLAPGERHQRRAGVDDEVHRVAVDAADHQIHSVWRRPDTHGGLLGRCKAGADAGAEAVTLAFPIDLQDRFAAGGGDQGDALRAGVAAAQKPALTVDDDDGGVFEKTHDGDALDRGGRSHEHGKHDGECEIAGQSGHARSVRELGGDR